MDGQGSLPVTPVFRPSFSFCSQFTDNTAKPKVYIGGKSIRCETWYKISGIHVFSIVSKSIAIFFLNLCA